MARVLTSLGWVCFLIRFRICDGSESESASIRAEARLLSGLQFAALNSATVAEPRSGDDVAQVLMKKAAGDEKIAYLLTC